MEVLVDVSYGTDTNVNQEKKDPKVDDYNMENISLVFYETTGQPFDDDWEKMKRKLCPMISRFFYFNQMKSMMDYFDSNVDQKILVIVNGEVSADTLSKIHSCTLVESVFVLNSMKNEYPSLYDHYFKVVGTFQTTDHLYEPLLMQSRIILKRSETFSIFKNQRSIKDMPKQFAHYLWFQLFNEVILHLSQDDHDRQQMIEFCRQYYHDSPNALLLIDNFEREYRPSDAIRWYTKQSFIYKILNYALRTEDINLLHVMRYYLKDLLANLIQERIPKEAGTIQLYRGTKLSRTEVDQLQSNIGKVLSINGFWSTSRCRTQALTFAPNIPLATEHFVSVLFEIQCEMVELDEIVLIADIAEFSEFPHEQEVIFGLNVCFRIESVCCDTIPCIIKLTTSNDNLPMTKHYLTETNERIQEFGGTVVYGRLMIKQGNYDEALKYFLSLLPQSHGIDQVHIEISIGIVYDCMSSYHRAEEHYNCAYNRLVDLGMGRSKYAAQIFYLIGVNLYSNGLFGQALERLQEAEKILLELFPSKHRLIGKCLNMIGLLHQRLCKYDLALEYFDRALAIKYCVTPSEHISIATYFCNMADTMEHLERYDEAKVFIEKALSIRDTYYPKDHILLGLAFQSYGSILCNMKDYDNALFYQKRALEIKSRYFPCDQVGIGRPLYHIGNILLQLRNYKEALRYFEEALMNSRKIPNRYSVCEIECIDGIGHVYCGLGQVSDGLNKYREAVRKKYLFLPIDHVEIARSLLNIGQALDKMGREKLALMYMRRSLKMFQKKLPFNHRNINENRNSIEKMSKNVGMFSK